MAPAKGAKPEVNPWGWATTLAVEQITEEHIFKAYRILDYRPCEVRQRNCKKNPYCCWGLGEKKWVQDPEDATEEDDNGFRDPGAHAGLQNLGATCYVNSLLQLWYHNPILRPAILRWQPSQEILSANSYKPNCPIAQLQAMFARMKESKQSKIDPTEFVTSLQLDTTEQQDAQEFSKLFLDVIVKLLDEYADGEVRKAITTACQGNLQNETECTRCNNKTRRQESFNELELGMRKNLAESLDAYLQDELLSGSEQYFCSMCNMKNDAHRRTQLLNLPPVLNLQLMRFVFDRETFRKKKVTTNIQFPETLDMTPRITPVRSNESCDPLVYQLTAVLIHNGPSASSGHYIAQIKDLKSGNWLTFNDETVREKENCKSKSKKLILKEEENGSGSDTEKKAKSKKGKSENHSSTGAYMLVYTLDRYVKNPEPDPELKPYLEALVKQEDETYESDLKKTKGDKDYETQQREERKAEIRLLYPGLVLDPSDKSETEEKSDEDFAEPPKKVPKTDRTNGAAKSKTLKNGTVDDENESAKSQRSNSKLPPKPVASKKTPSNNGTGTKIANGKPSTMDIEKCDFISVDWMQQWLDGNNPPEPIKSSMLLCEHGKLFPPQPNSIPCLYRIVPSNFADLLYDHYKSDGARLQGRNALCEICVKNECGRLKMIQELEDDHKLFQEINKKFDAFSTGTGKITSVSDVEDFTSDTHCWISKDSLRNWKRLAKKRIEEQFKLTSNIERQTEPEIADESSDSGGPLNSELICNHDELYPDTSVRKKIPFRSWSILAKYFPDGIHIPVGGKSTCQMCQNENNDACKMRDHYKDVATKQKADLLDLYHLRNRPDLNIRGEYYIVSLSFVNLWKKFIKEPGRNVPVTEIKNKKLLCEHGLLQYPLHLVADIFPSDDSNHETLCIVHPSEWQTMKDIFPVVDHEIKVEIIDPVDKSAIIYTPDKCHECSTLCWEENFKKRFIYKNESIYVIRRDKESDEEDELFVPVQPSLSNGKRERRQRDPSSWQSKPVYMQGKDNGGVRRSNRPRRQRGEKVYKLSSSQTLKDLKVMILKDFKAMPSDQHIFHNEIELTDVTKTLQELEIPAESKLYLEIDTECKDQEEPAPTTLETGFQGTLLMGARKISPSPSPANNITDTVANNVAETETLENNATEIGILALDQEIKMEIDTTTSTTED